MIRSLLLISLLSGPAFAVRPPQDIPEAQLTLPAPANPPPAAHEVDPITNEVSSKLRCPVCQGMSVGDSPSESAVTMKKRIRELVSQGYNEKQIQDYFISRYSEWILLDPQLKGANQLLFIVPVGIFLAGLAMAGAYATQWKPPQARNSVPKTQSNDQPSDKTLDPYEAEFLAQLEDPCP